MGVDNVRGSKARALGQIRLCVVPTGASRPLDPGTRHPQTSHGDRPKPSPWIRRSEAGGVGGQRPAFARSSSSWQVMQSLAKGSASRRRSLIISPHDSQRP